MQLQIDGMLGGGRVLLPAQWCVEAGEVPGRRLLIYGELLFFRLVRYLLRLPSVLLADTKLAQIIYRHF